jgi:hypothetical protein
MKPLRGDEIGAVVDHMCNNGSENFIDGEDFVRDPHWFILMTIRTERKKKRKTFM